MHVEPARTGHLEKNASARAIFSLFNLGCSGCSGIIEGKLKKLSGIKKATVNYITDTVLVDYDPSRVGPEDIRSFMKKLGYDATEHRHGP